MTSPMKSHLATEAQIAIHEDRLYGDSDEEDEQSVPGKEVRGRKESLFDFLERQTRNQIKYTLGHKMGVISKRILDSVRKTDEQRANRLARESLYKTPGRSRRDDRDQNRSASRLKYMGVSASKAEQEGQPRLAQIEDANRVILKEPDMPYPHELRDTLKQLVDNIKDKQSLVDLFRQKLAQNKHIYANTRTRLNLAKEEISEKTFNEIDENLIDLQNQNQHWWNTLDDNENANAHMLDDLGDLLSLHDRERQALKEGYQNMIDKQRGYDKGKYEAEITKLRNENNDLQHENKILKENYDQGGAASVEHKQLVQELASLENHNKYLSDENKQKDKEKNNLHNEVNRLKAQLREIEKLYDSELGQQKERNQQMLEQIHQGAPQTASLSNQIVSLQAENDVLKSQIAELKNALDERGAADDEVRIRQQMSQEREEDGDVEQLKAQIDNLENQRQKQKNEWAEIYGNLKQEIEDSKQDTQLLNAENERLVQQIQLLEQESSVKGSDRDALKRLKKKELECNQLWETLKDMHVSNKGVFDARQMMELLSIRQLESKARRKLKVQ